MDPKEDDRLELEETLRDKKVQHIESMDRLERLQKQLSEQCRARGREHQGNKKFRDDAELQLQESTALPVSAEVGRAGQVVCSSRVEAPAPDTDAEAARRTEADQLRRLHSLQCILFEMLTNGREEDDELVAKMEAAANLSELDRVSLQRARKQEHLLEHWQHQDFAKLYERALHRLDTEVEEDSLAGGAKGASVIGNYASGYVFVRLVEVHGLDEAGVFREAEEGGRGNRWERGGGGGDVGELEGRKTKIHGLFLVRLARDETVQSLKEKVSRKWNGRIPPRLQRVVFAGRAIDMEHTGATSLRDCMIAEKSIVHVVVPSKVLKDADTGVESVCVCMCARVRLYCMSTGKRDFRF